LVTRRFLVLAVLLNISTVAFNQENIKGARVVTSDNTPALIDHALIVGISEYLNIDDLQFAHIDALSFYHYLRSPAGGSLDTSKIILLLNEDATSANFFAGLDWLLNETKEGETVAVYFSGHGDLETKTIRQNGFLLGYDSPKACYMAGAIGIGYVQDYLSTLVSTNKAKVILITDACRSGKLTGGSEGLKNTTAALAEQWENITKILSSQAGELSMESTKWGDGAGVFTYYLTRGLEGLADRNHDNTVNLLELNIYLNDNVPRETDFNQNPAVDGKQTTIIARIDSLTLIALQNQSGSESIQNVSLASRGFPEALEKELDPDLIELYQNFRRSIDQGRLVNDYLKKDTLNANYYYIKLISDIRAGKIQDRLYRILLAALQNKTQLYLNNYVRGKDLSDSIDLFQAFLEQEKALEMTDPNIILYNDVKARYLFLKSLCMRNDMESLKLLEECVAIEPDAAYAINEIGTIYLGLNQYDRAKNKFEDAIDLAPNWSYPYNNLGIAFYKQKQFDISRQYYMQAIEKDPLSGSPYYNLGILCSATGDTAEAIFYYNKAILTDSAYRDAYLNLAAIKISRKEYSDAENLFIECARKADPQAGYYYLGIMYFSIGEYKKALDYYYRTLQYNSLSKRTLYNIGETYLYLNNRDSALKYLDLALLQDPGYVDVWYRKGDVYATFAEYDSAENCFIRVTELDPANKNIYSSLGDLNFITSDYESAVNYYKKAVQNSPENAEVWYTIGICYEMLGVIQNAIPCFQKCLELSPANSNYLTSFGLAYLITGRYPESKDLFLKSIEIAPDDPMNYYYMASLYSLMGMNKEGLEWLEKSLDKGFNQFEYLQSDPGMEGLRGMMEFQELVKRYIKE
jgi:tetratricopeptide (TPR) repeat protein